MADLLLEGLVFSLLIGEFCNSHGCRDAESWVVLFDSNILPHNALQLSAGLTHLGCEMALECHNYSSADCKDMVDVTRLHQAVVAFFRGRLTSRAFSVVTMMS